MLLGLGWGGCCARGWLVRKDAWRRLGILAWLIWLTVLARLLVLLLLHLLLLTLQFLQKLLWCFRRGWLAVVLLILIRLSVGGSLVVRGVAVLCIVVAGWADFSRGSVHDGWRRFETALRSAWAIRGCCYDV